MATNSTSSIIIGTAFAMTILGGIGGLGLYYLQNPGISERQLQESGQVSPSNNPFNLTGQQPSSRTEATSANFDEIIIPGTRQGNALYVQVELNDFKDVTLLVDTGATDIILQPNVAYDLGLLESESQEALYDTPGGRTQFFITELDTVRLGDAVQHHIRASFGNGLPGFADGLLGMSFLKHYVVNVDLVREQLHLRLRQ